jgi:hypothetical protein
MDRTGSTRSPVDEWRGRTVQPEDPARVPLSVVTLALENLFRGLANYTHRFLVTMTLVGLNLFFCSLVAYAFAPSSSPAATPSSRSCSAPWSSQAG